MTKSKILVGTRKGLIVMDRSQSSWKIRGHHFDGIPVSIAYEDERSGDWWVALDHGHWGIKLHRSRDQGQHWVELDAPKYPKGSTIKGDVDASLRYIWSLASAGDVDSDLWIGTEPGGLFRIGSDNRSVLNESLWNHPSREDHWFGGGRDYAGIHSIVVDSEDYNRIFVGISVAGVFESKDGGRHWNPCNKGLRADFLPDPYPEVGHDPHLLVQCRHHPNVLWQQNHCGIFRSEDRGRNWIDVSMPQGPAKFGFAITCDHADKDRAWVVPAVSDEIRVAVEHSLCVCRTDDGGRSWQTFRRGLPQEHCYDIVYRHCLISQDSQVLFGTTTGNLFASEDAGESWQVISNYLPMVYCLAFAD